MLAVVPGYEVLRPLGAGGMGDVLLARDEMLLRQVAIKTIAPRLTDSEAARQRFRREARAMATIDHPNVVRVHSYGEVAGQAYLVMEYVDGESLAQRLAHHGPLAAAEALRITREVAEALGAAWRHGIVHRDVKPANILLDAEGRVRVADFGLARPIGEIEGDVSTEGTVLGTPDYMSPEQARGDDLDFRSDLYALGIVLFEMLSGRRPFVGKPVEVLAGHLDRPLPAIPALGPDGLRAAEIVAWLTRKKRDDRPSSYGELLRALRADPGPPEGATLTSSGLTPARPRPAGRRRGPAALAAVLALLAVSALAYRAVSSRGHVQRIPGTRAVVVVPFDGADDDSRAEGRAAATFVARELSRRLTDGRVQVVSVDRAVRSAADARALAVELDAAVVVWGEALAFRGEAELVPHVTRAAGGAASNAGPPLLLPAGGGSQIEVRQRAAAGIAQEAVEAPGPALTPS